MALSLDRIVSVLSARDPVVLPREEGITAAAVLVLLSDGPAGVQALLTVRSDRVRHHKGQVSFPGGVVEEGDPDELTAALREAGEEIGLARGAARIVGRLDDYVTITGYHVVPFAAVIPGFDGLAPLTDEIVEVFAFPLAVMADPARVRAVPMERHGRVEDVLFVEHEGRLVWGATARILYHLMEVVSC